MYLIFDYLTTDEYENVKVGSTINGRYMKVSIPGRQFATDYMVDLTTGEVKHWSRYINYKLPKA